MKSETEIEQAHDLIVALMAICGRKIAEDESSYIVTGVVFDVLCWVLNHSGDTQTQKLLDHLEQMFRRLEVAVVDAEETERKIRKAWSN